MTRFTKIGTIIMAAGASAQVVMTRFTKIGTKLKAEASTKKPKKGKKALQARGLVKRSLHVSKARGFCWQPLRERSSGGPVPVGTPKLPGDCFAGDCMFQVTLVTAVPSQPTGRSAAVPALAEGLRGAF